MEPTNVTGASRVNESSADNCSSNLLIKNKHFDFNRGRGGRGGRAGGRYGRGRYGKENFPLGFNNEHRDQMQDSSPSTSMESGKFHKTLRTPVEKILERAQQLSGNTYDLPHKDMSEKKFNSRNRLYIGNIGPDVTEKSLEELFKKYGECAEIFINKEKKFAFIKMDYHCNAEKAKKELDGTTLNLKTLRIRFAPNSNSVKVKNLTPFVSNELLYYAFSIFGEIERAVICVDEKGKPIGEGIIDFSRKGAALAAVRTCAENCFFLTSSFRPCVVDGFEAIDTVDGFSEKTFFKKNPEFIKERELGPRFAAKGSFEDEYGRRWKQLYDLHSKKEEAQKKELSLEMEKMEAQLEYAKYEHETEVLKKKLKEREMFKEKTQREWEIKERQLEQERMRNQEVVRRSREEMDAWISSQQEDTMRKQAHNLFFQAQSLNSLLEIQERAYAGTSRDSSIELPRDPLGFERPIIRRHSLENNGVWLNNNNRDKRRKY